MFLCGVFISGPCFIVANTHHQVPQWVVNHLHSIMPSMTSLLNCRKEVSLTWMIIAWTPYMQGSQLVQQRMRRSLADIETKDIFSSCKQLPREGDIPSLLLPVTPKTFETEDSNTFWSLVPTLKEWKKIEFSAKFSLFSSLENQLTSAGFLNSKMS